MTVIFLGRVTKPIMILTKWNKDSHSLTARPMEFVPAELRHSDVLIG